MLPTFYRYNLTRFINYIGTLIIHDESLASTECWCQFGCSDFVGKLELLPLVIDIQWLANGIGIATNHIHDRIDQTFKSALTLADRSQSLIKRPCRQILARNNQSSRSIHVAEFPFFIGNYAFLFREERKRTGKQWLGLVHWLDLALKIKNRLYPITSVFTFQYQGIAVGEVSDWVGCNRHNNGACIIHNTDQAILLDLKQLFGEWANWLIICWEYPVRRLCLPWKSQGKAQYGTQEIMWCAVISSSERTT